MLSKEQVVYVLRSGVCNGIHRQLREIAVAG
jgi:hypothetical protein